MLRPDIPQLLFLYIGLYMPRVSLLVQIIGRRLHLVPFIFFHPSGKPRINGDILLLFVYSVSYLIL